MTFIGKISKVPINIARVKDEIILGIFKYLQIKYNEYVTY